MTREKLKNYKYCDMFKFRFINSQTDAELIYDNKVFNYQEIEMPMWENYIEYYNEEGIELDDTNDKQFVEYCKDNQYQFKDIVEHLIEIKKYR